MQNSPLELKDIATLSLMGMDIIRGLIDAYTRNANQLTEGMFQGTPFGLVEVPVFGDGQKPLLVEKNTGVAMNQYLAMSRMLVSLTR